MRPLQFWTEKASRWELKRLQDHKNKSSCSDSTFSTSWWPGWMRAFADHHHYMTALILKRIWVCAEAPWCSPQCDATTHTHRDGVLKCQAIWVQEQTAVGSWSFSAGCRSALKSSDTSRCFLCELLFAPNCAMENSAKFVQRVLSVSTLSWIHPEGFRHCCMD